MFTFESFAENLVAMRRMSMAERRSSDGKGLANNNRLKFIYYLFIYSSAGGRKYKGIKYKGMK